MKNNWNYRNNNKNKLNLCFLLWFKSWVFIWFKQDHLGQDYQILSTEVETRAPPGSTETNWSLYIKYEQHEYTAIT